MKILTIAREMGAIDYDYETVICKKLGVRLVHKEELEEHFKSLGANTSIMHRLDERKPRVVDSFFSRADVYFETLRTAVLHEVAKDNVAIIGRGANFIVHEIINCTRLRFIAPMEVRVARVAEKQNCSKEQATAIVKKSDRERIGFCNYYYDKDWRDPEGYDLTINTAEIPFEKFLENAEQIMQLKTPLPNQEQKIKDALLCQSVKYSLSIAEHLDIRFLQVICDNGNITLRGAVSSPGVAMRAVDIARKTDGVTEVQNQLNVILQNIPRRFE